MEVVHPRTVFLAERDLAFVLQLGEDGIAQGGVFGRLAKLRQRGGVFLRDKLLRFGGLEVFQRLVRVLHFVCFRMDRKRGRF